MNYVPIVVEQVPNGERAYDLYSRLLRDRIIFIGTEFHAGLANVVVAQMLYLESQDESEDIYIYINSPGGVISSGLAISRSPSSSPIISSSMCKRPAVSRMMVSHICSRAMAFAFGFAQAQDHLGKGRGLTGLALDQLLGHFAHQVLDRHALAGGDLLEPPLGFEQDPG